MKTKQIFSLVFAAVIIASEIHPAAKTVPNYEISESFEAIDAAGLAAGCTASLASTAKDGKAAVMIADRESFESGFTYELKNIPPNSQNEVGVWVRLSAGREKFRLIAEFESGGSSIRGSIGEKDVAAGSWVYVSGKLSTLFKKVNGNVTLKIETAPLNGQTTPSDYMVDALSLVSDKASEADMVEDVPSILHDGNYTVRVAFDNMSDGGFIAQGQPTLTITDEVLPHTGKYCFKVSGRGASWHTTLINIDDIPENATASVSVWVRTPAGSGIKNFGVQIMGMTSSAKTIASASVNEDTWTKMTGGFSLKGIKKAGELKLQIITGEASTAASFTDFYVDDFLLTTDVPGDIKDDMLLSVSDEVRDENVSDTPYRESITPVEIEHDIVSLKDAMEPYFKMGASFTNDRIKNENHNELFLKHFSVGTPEGPFHMSAVRNVDGTYDFTEADKFMDYCMKNGKEVIGHCLIWDHAAQKKYLLNPDGSYISREEAIALIEDHIKTMAEHFNDPSKGWKIRGWDVVNEAVLDTRVDELKDYAGYSTILGEDYLYYAFKFAEKYMPGQELYYNDYGLLNDVKRESVYNLIKRLKERGCRIDAIGMQSHYSLDFDPYKVRHSIEKFKSLGVRIEITELDISVYTTEQMKAKKPIYDKGILKTAEDLQTWEYYEMFEIYREYSDIINRVTLWGVYDGRSFRNSKEFNKVDYPLLFDREYKAKDSFWAIVNPEEYEKATGLDIEYKKPKMYLADKKLDIDETDFQVIDGVLYAPIRKVFDQMSIRLAYSGATKTVTVIKNGKMLTLAEESNKGTLDFAPVEVEGVLKYNENGAIIVPIDSVLKLLGYTTRWNAKRNTLFVYNI